MAAPSTTSTGPRPVLFLTEEDVRRLLTMEMAVEAVEQGLRKLALDEAHNVPRARAQTDHAMLHLMGIFASDEVLPPLVPVDEQRRVLLQLACDNTPARSRS